MKKILLIEDEPNVASFIERGLTENNFPVDVAYDGKTALEKFDSGTNYDLVILDVILPDTTGFELCTLFRQRAGYTIPIIMLTALNTTDDIVKGLDSGADDYLSKPFRFQELTARIRALLRRSDTPETEILKIADLEMNLETKTVVRAGVPVTLTAREFRLLEYFMRNPKKVLSRSAILEYVWEVHFDLSTNVVDVYVNYLRNKIDKNFSSKLIHTKIGMGYVLREE